jgi:hypothetical protein
MQPPCAKGNPAKSRKLRFVGGKKTLSSDSTQVGRGENYNYRLGAFGFEVSSGALITSVALLNST